MATHFSVDGLLLSSAKPYTETVKSQKEAIHRAAQLVSDYPSTAASVGQVVGKEGKLEEAWNIFFVNIAQTKPFAGEKGYLTVFQGTAV